MATTIQPGETDSAKRTIYFPIFDKAGLITSGEAQGITEGWASAVVTFAAGDVKVEHERDGYATALGTVGHHGSGEYFYTFDPAEVAATLADGTVAMRFLKTGYKTVTVRVDFRHDMPGGVVRANSMEDNFVYTGGRLTSVRLRVFATAAALALATPGRANGLDGEIERYTGTTTYNADGTYASFAWSRTL